MQIQNFKNNKFAEISNECVGIIETDHLMVHQGKSFIYTRNDTLNSDISVNIGMYLPVTSNVCHLLFLANGKSQYTLKIFEDAVYTGGTPITAKNRNRIYKNTLHQTLLVLNPTITNVGTELLNEIVGIGQQSGGDSRDNNEWILSPETYYLLRITSNSASNVINQLVEFYENLIEKL